MFVPFFHPSVVPLRLRFSGLFFNGSVLAAIRSAKFAPAPDYLRNNVFKRKIKVGFANGEVKVGAKG